MRRENGKRKGLNRLLVLVLAAAITMAFSFTSISFADGNEGVSESSSSFTKSMQVNGKTFTLEGLTPIAGETYHNSVSRSTDATLYSGKTAYIQSRPFKGTKCDECRTYIYGCTALDYYVSGYEITEGTNDIVKDDSYDLVGVKSSDKFNGEPGLRFTFTANRPGKATLKFTYYYKYNSPGTGGYVQCQNPECANYQQDPSYDVGPDPYLYQWNQTINLTVLTNYSIKYDANGGSDAPQTEEFNDTEDNSHEFVISSTIPAREGYTFLGWADSNDANSAAYKAGDTCQLTWPETSKTLYAVWAKNSPTQYTVTYHSDDHVVKTDQVNPGNTTTAPADLQKDGYHLDGWYKNASFTGDKYYFEDAVNSSFDLYAKWIKNNTPTIPTTPTTPSTPSTPSEEHKVIITPNNGDPDITQTVPDGGKAVEPEDLVKDGYKLDGWYTDSALTKPFDFSQPIKNDVHVYAKWTKTNAPVKPAKPASKKVTGILLPKVIAKGKHTQTLTWTALKNVDGYFIYTNHCDEAQGRIPHPFKKVADYKASKARVFTKKNLKTYHNYKYYVAAYKIKNGKKVIVRNSVTVHSVCGNTSARSTNVKSVKVSKHAVTLKKGQTYKVKASISKVNKKRAFLDATHCGLLRYLTADSSIATVNYSIGTIKAKKAGKTTVYVLGVNGIRDKVVVTVK